MAYKMKTSVSGLCSPLQQSYEVGSKRHSRKLKKQGKSAKAAGAIAGAMASYKAKGGGKGPTAKQK